ncbi:MAG: hypothetical protein V3T76_01050, partial [candidate division NC10 bacterium]
GAVCGDQGGTAKRGLLVLHRGRYNAQLNSCITQETPSRRGVRNEQKAAGMADAHGRKRAPAWSFPELPKVHGGRQVLAFCPNLAW